MTIDINVQMIDRVLSALDELTDDNPGLESSVDFYEEILPMMIAARPALHGLTLNLEAAQTKLKEGVPLLWGELSAPDALGMEPNIDLFLTLCRVTAENGNDDGENLMRAFVDGSLELKPMLRQALIQDQAGLLETAEAWQVDPALLATLSRFLLTPIARAYAIAFSQALQFGSWQQGYCPVCGAWPVLAELRGRDKLRYLDCGRCGTSWVFKRLGCLWCGNTNEKQLSFLFDSDQAVRRIDVCDKCHGYIKTITSFDPLEPDMLLVHDLETAYLDQMAADQGYRRLNVQPKP